MSYSLQQIMSEVPRDHPGVAKGANSLDGHLQGDAVRIAGNSKDALECGVPRKVVSAVEAFVVEKARGRHAEAAIRFQANVLKSLAPAGTDAVNVGGLAVGIESKITSFFDEVEPGVFRFRLADFLAEIEALRCFRG